MVDFGETFSHKKFSKSILGFEKWTKKMSKNEYPKILLKKTSPKTTCEHNALIFVFCLKKSVTIKFLCFFKKDLNTFFC